MPTFTSSAMNPFGSWQHDAMDDAEQANRNAAMQSAQMANEIAFRNLQARLEHQHMAQQGSQFSQDLAARTGMHDEDLANSRLLQSGSQDFARGQLAQELAARNHAADLQFGPDSLAQKQYAEALAQRQWERDFLTGGGGLPGAQTAASPVSQPDMAAMKQMPPDMASNPMAGYGGGAMPAPQHAAPAAGGLQAPAGVDPTLYKMAVISALHGGSMPDFFMQNLNHQTAQMGLDEHQREIAQGRIQEALNAGDVTTAHQIAQASGAQMPLIPVEQVVSRPDVQMKLSQIDKLTDLASKAYNDKESVDTLRRASEDAIAALVSRGVDPKDAAAVVHQRILSRVPGRYGTAGAIASDWGYLMFQPELFGQEPKSDRVNMIHDFAGE